MLVINEVVFPTESHSTIESKCKKSISYHSHFSSIEYFDILDNGNKQTQVTLFPPSFVPSLPVCEVMYIAGSMKKHHS
jgi:hypothetical protein